MELPVKQSGETESQYEMRYKGYILWKEELEKQKITKATSDNKTTSDAPQMNQCFESGAIRQSRPIGKGAYYLISPIAMHRIAQTMAEGAVKYNDRNWEKGIPMSNYVDSIMRHMNQYLAGASDEDHLAHAAANIMMLLHTETMVKKMELPNTLNDLPCYMRGCDIFTDWQEESNILKGKTE